MMIKEFWYDTVDSTMEEAKRLIQSGQIKNCGYVVADHQTSGRGTHGRKWDSPKGSGIYLSIVHLPEEKKLLKLTTDYTLACGIACVEVISKICSVDAKLKPVNDLYVNSKKLGGILVESKIKDHGFSYLITGIGINTHNTLHTLDRRGVEPISLEELMSESLFKKFSKEKLIKLLVNRVCMWYKKIFCGKPFEVRSKWELYSL